MNQTIIPQIIATKLTKDAERHLRSGHPWIYSKSVIKMSKDGRAGDVCIIYDQKKNQMMAIGLYDPSSPIRIKVLDQGKNIQLNSAYWLNKVQHSFIKRYPLLETDTNAFRMIFGENDGFPGLILDVYNRTGVVKLYSEIWIPHFSLILDAIIQTIDLDAIVMRLSRNLEKSSNLPNTWKNGGVLYGHLANEEINFREHGILFKTNVIKGHKTGFFLDHRHNRIKVGALSEGKKVLDVFSYAGGFSVHALAGNATEVVSLDISVQAQEHAKKNVQLNNLGDRHKAVIGDAFQEMQKMIDKEQKYDIVVIDPPSFASKERQVKGALASYCTLVQMGANLVEAGGMLVMASCSSRINNLVFFDLVQNTLDGHKNFQKGDWRCVNQTGHDIDHPITFSEGAYLKCGYYLRQ